MPSGYAQGTYKRWSNLESGDPDSDHITIDYRSAVKAKCCEECLEGRKGFVLKILLCVTLFFLGLTIGYFVRKGQPEEVKNEPENLALRGLLMRELAKTKVNVTNIETHLRDYSRNIHLAGTSNADKIADSIRDKWKSYGMNNVHQRFYKVLLSYPDQNDFSPNKITLKDEAGKSKFEFTNSDGSDDLEASSARRNYLDAFHAYSPSGTVEGEPIFVNYGRKEDFVYLANANISFNGSILIMRQGGVYIGNKVKLAEQYGAAGIISFPDPDDYALDRRDGHAYPETWWLPRDHRQWGTIGKLDFGDPLTPDMPAILGSVNKNVDPMSLDHKSGDMYAIKLADADLPKIPVQGLSWGAARQIMLNMASDSVRTKGHWKGALPIGEGLYNAGPGYSGEREGWKVRLEVNNKLQLKKIVNVVGMIKGNEEADRYVIVGSHHDSWTYGAVDPGSGLSILMELSRVFSDMVKNEGWKPRRTILFVSFDAEKFGRIGSREWVEEYAKELSERAVAFISLDVGITGNYTFKAEADLMLRKLIYDTTKNTTSPFSASGSLYSWWNSKAGSKTAMGVPDIPRLGAGGDYTNFIHRLGIPSMDMTFTSAFSNIHWDRSIYPSYNSAIDTFTYITKFLDHEFTFHSNLTTMYVDVIMRLADSEQLPLVEDDIVDAMNEGLAILDKNVDVKNVLGNLFHKIYNAVREFEQRSSQFRKQYDFDVNRTNHEATVRTFNDRVMTVSRSFISQHGLKTRPHIKNILLGPSADNAYKAEVFPGVQDAIRNNDNEALVKEVWRLVLAIYDAAGALCDGFVSENPVYLK